MEWYKILRLINVDAYEKLQKIRPDYKDCEGLDSCMVFKDQEEGEHFWSRMQNRIERLEKIPKTIDFLRKCRICLDSEMYDWLIKNKLRSIIRHQYRDLDCAVNWSMAPRGTDYWNDKYIEVINCKIQGNIEENERI